MHTNLWTKRMAALASLATATAFGLGGVTTVAWAADTDPPAAPAAPDLVATSDTSTPQPSVVVDPTLQPSTSDPLFTGGEYQWGVNVWTPANPVDDTSTDPPTPAVPLTVGFAWGDGSSSTVSSTDPQAAVWCDNGNSGWACSVWAEHVYTAQGLYTVTVTASQAGASSGSTSAEVFVYDLKLGGSIRGSGTLEARSGGMYQQSFTSGTATFEITAKRRAGSAATTASLVVSVPSMVADYTGATGMTFTSQTATRPLYVQKLGRNSYEVFLERVYGAVTNSAGPAGTALATFHAIITKGQPTLVRISVWNTSAGYTYMDTGAAADTTYAAISADDQLLTGSLRVG